MNDYYSLKIKFSPFTEDTADLMAGFLSDIEFESFETNDTEGTLIAYIKSEHYDEQLWNETINSFPLSCGISWESEFIEGKDWNQEWERNYFKPIVLGGECVIHATFHHDYPQAKHDILIDPKMAFGTGHHATTSMMVSHLLAIDCKGKTVYDMGTGTGILAILAKKLGAKTVTGIEIDPAAHENACDNAALNNTNVNFICGDASTLSNLGKADIFLANINRNIILADLPVYIEHTKHDGVIILSGFYEGDMPILEKAISWHGMKIASKMVREEWCSLIIEFI